MSSIQVAIRVRPIRASEGPAGGMEILPDSKRILFGPKAFDCDQLLGHETTQDELYNSTQCRNIVETVTEGQRGAILVYGQTGTGKTHTMFGPPTGAPDGVVFQSVSHILDTIQGQKASLSVSVVEVYMERVTDLFQNKEVNVYCGQARDVEWRSVATIFEAQKTIFGALNSRHVASTSMNDRSSRSHVIVNLKVLRPSGMTTEDGKDKIEASNLMLVDLAGSECIGKSKATGKTAHEASSINKSLLALKQIILSLSSTSQSQTHIPYRDSKLTELLQDSIGGCSRTLMIACVSPAARDIEETKSTLEYATKARQIKNLAQTDKERMAIKIKTLELELQKAKNRLDQQASERGCVVVTKADYDEFVALGAKYETTCEELKKQYEEKEQAVNYQNYHAGVEKMLRDTIEQYQAKLDDAQGLANFRAAKVKESLETHRSEVYQVMRGQAENMTAAMDDLRQAVAQCKISDDAVSTFMKAVDSVRAYASSNVEAVISDMATRLSLIQSDSEAVIAEYRQEEARRVKISKLFAEINALYEESNQKCNAATDRLDTMSTNAKLYATTLAKQPTDFISRAALQTVFVNETDKFRDEVVATTTCHPSATLATPDAPDAILNRGIARTLRAAVEKRTRSQIEEESNGAPSTLVAPIQCEEATSKSVEEQAVPVAVAPKKGSAATRSLTASAAFVDPKKRKVTKSVLSNSTNIVS